MPTCTQGGISKLWSADNRSWEDKNGNYSKCFGSNSPPATSPTSSPISNRSFTSTVTADSRSMIHVNVHPHRHRYKSRGLLFRTCETFKDFVLTLFQLVWSQMLIGPTLLVSIWLWLFWKCVSIPLGTSKWILTICQTSPVEQFRKKRCVLISGGSTVQSLHLARNFYSAGARVVICEIDGCFDLTRFSTAVNKFYTVPRPDTSNVQDYINALCNIVAKENVSYYIPVSATSEAIFDALAKPHLELLNCVVFCPSLKEVRLFDDIFEVLEKCKSIGLATPLYYHITSPSDIYRLYESGVLRSARHFMTTVGTNGIRTPLKFEIPPFRQDFKLNSEISFHKPWIVIQDLKGEHFITCTTVKDGIVVANISCRVEKKRGSMIPVENSDITKWIQLFICRLKQKSLSGHFTFQFVISGNGVVVPLGCKVGVPLSYICHSSVHARIVWKPCKHFSRQASGPLILNKPNYWMDDAVLKTLKSPSVEAVNSFIGTVLDQREVLFVYWDPLPYCAFYHLLLPIQIILDFVRGQTQEPKNFLSGHLFF